ncbi:MAG: CrcB family protein [Pirellulaceae bacterium]
MNRAAPSATVIATEKIALIALFGAAGAVARYSVSGWVYRLLGESVPYGTLAVNVLGGFLLGAVAHVNRTTELIPPHFRPVVTIGMLGGFTTFST